MKRPACVNVLSNRRSPAVDIYVTPFMTVIHSFSVSPGGGSGKATASVRRPVFDDVNVNIPPLKLCSSESRYPSPNCSASKCIADGMTHSGYERQTIKCLSPPQVFTCISGNNIHKCIVYIHKVCRA